MNRGFHFLAAPRSEFDEHLLSRKVKTLMSSGPNKGASWSVASPQTRKFLTPLESKSTLQLLVIVLAAALLCAPCLMHGLPSGTNAPTHVKYQHHFSGQFWNGERYPRWLADENKGYGSPIFLVQYPFPYFVTALLRPITSFPPANRESRELGLFVCLALAAAGVGAWHWFRKLTSPLAATLAAVVYMSLPFILQDGIYARTAIGELCTFIWMPVALSLCESMYERRNAIFTLSGIFALLVVSNLLSAVLFAPVLTIYAILCGKRSELSWYRRAWLVGLAQLLGAGMAGMYLVPLLAHRRLFDLHQMETILPGYQFALYFLNLTSSNLRAQVVAIGLGGAVLFAGAAAWYIWHAAVDVHIRICMGLALLLGVLTLIPNLGRTIIRLSGFEFRPLPPDDFVVTTLLGLFFTIALGFLAYCRIAESSVAQRGTLLLGIAVASFFLMLPFSAPIWRAIPGSSVFQFPFRLGGILCVAVAGLVSFAFDSCLRDLPGPRNRPSRLVIVLAAIAAVTGGFLTWRTDRAFRHPKSTAFDVTQDFDPMYRAYVPLRYLSAFAKDLGTTPDSFEAETMPGDGTLRSELMNGNCDLNVKRENSREIFISSDCRGEARLRIGQLYSPLWKVVPVQGVSLDSTVSVSADGLMELTLSPGKQDMRLVFDMGAPGRWGAILSEASLLFGVIGFVFSPRRAVRALPEIPVNLK
jgi:hypothetical protein